MQVVSVQFIVTVVAVLVVVCPGNTEMTCDFDKTCLPIYNNMKGMFEEQNTSDMATLCSFSHDLKDCMKKTSKRCRGVLNYHVLEKLARDLNANVGVGKNCVRGSSSENNSSPSTTSGRGHSSQSGGSPEHHHGGRGHGRNRGRSQQGVDRCAPKYPADSPTAGCALFGLTNLKSFSEPLNFTDINYCSLAGAWNLIDTPEFAVQITNKGGLSPIPKDVTATTLVTVIIKNNQCSERKTYQATFDEVPGMFSDGYTTAGGVYIETIVESDHVKIHFPSILATIDIIKVIDKIPIPSLAVAIKLPESLAQSYMSDPKSLRGLPLCFYGCPRTATVKPKSPSTDSESGRSSSTSYYKSSCPKPETYTTSSSSSEEEHVLADSPTASVPLTSGTLIRHQSSKRMRLSSGEHDLSSGQRDLSSSHPAADGTSGGSDDTEFSASLSNEFLSQGDSAFVVPSQSSSESDFGGQRSQRSSTSNTAVICASLSSVYSVLSESKVVGPKLRFPGEERLLRDLSDTNSAGGTSFANVMNSALTSQSASFSRFHFILMLFSTVVICTWS